MDNKEKVAEDLEAMATVCLIAANTDEDQENREMFADWEVILRKAIELLKDPEPRLLTPEEIKKMKAGDRLAVEKYIEHDGKIVPNACWSIHTGSLILSLHGTMFPETINRIPYKTLSADEERDGHYKEIFRFWNIKPTSERMMQEPWNLEEDSDGVQT